MAPRRQPSSSSRDHSRRGQLRSRLFAAGALGLTSLGATWPSCSSLPPCFDDSATYRVQLLERLPESNCDPSLELDWVFEVRPRTGDEPSQTCSKAALDFILAPPGESSQWLYGGGNHLREPMQRVGMISSSIIVNHNGCQSSLTIEAFIPTETETVVDALPENRVVWQIYRRTPESDCATPPAQYASCTDYYTSITEKI